MPIRWKLLALLLAIALIPLLSVSWFDQSITRSTGAELAAMNRQILVEGASRQLIQMVGDYAALIKREREILELAVHVQADRIERALAGPGAEGEPVYFDHNLDKGRSLPPGMLFSSEHFKKNKDGVVRPLSVSYLAQVFRVAPPRKKAAATPEMAKLGNVTEAYQFLKRQHPKLIYWQSTALESGLLSAYPAHGNFPEKYDPLREEWYLKAREADSLVWLPPRPDRFTTQTVLTVARPVHHPGGGPAGVTAIDVPLPALLQASRLSAEWATAMRTMIVDISFKPNSDDLGLRIIADYRFRSERGENEPVEGRSWLETGDKWEQEALIQEMIAGHSGVSQISFEGRDSLWAYGPIDLGRTYLVFIMPHQEITSEAKAVESYVIDRTTDQLKVTGLVLLVVVLIVILVALVGSRSVTMPVRSLLGMARKIAEGDLEARAEISSRDELAELGRSFNDMVPRLRDQMRMRQSLSLAMEVQQNLLPSEPPRIEGFDLAGRSIYSDQTGGDYYDFIELHHEGRNLVGVAVGDVTGHGIAAALLMTTARALIRSLASAPGNLSRMMRRTNRSLAADAYAGRYMTLFFLVLDPDRRTVHWTSAGHDPALVYDPLEGRFGELAGTDIPLGIETEWPFKEFSRGDWAEGQIIVLGTDGIWETRNPAGRMFGKDRLQTIVRENAGLSAEEILEAITRALVEFRQDRTQTDDVTAVVIKVTG